MGKMGSCSVGVFLGVGLRTSKTRRELSVEI